MRFQNSNRRIRLVIFDLDGTLTRSPNVWRHLHMELGTWEAGKISAQKYLDGEIDYRKWAELDCALWKGTELAKILGITSRIKYFDGAVETVRKLKEAGIKVGIVSAGISVLAERAAKELGADITFSNRLLVADGALTGEIETNVSIDEKPRIIRDIAASLGISMSEVVVVGDNVFDMPEEAGLKITFNPRSKEAADAADFLVKGDDLREVLSLILPEAMR